MALINYPGSVAAVATTFADYFCAAVGLDVHYWVKPVAAGAIAFIVGVNFFGIRAGSRMLNLFTVLKLSAIALGVVACVAFAHGRFGAVLAADPVRQASPWAFLGALLPVLFSYGASTTSTTWRAKCASRSGRCRAPWGWAWRAWWCATCWSMSPTSQAWAT